MKLPDFSEFEPFNKLKQMMKAKSSSSFVAKDAPWHIGEEEISLLDKSYLSVKNIDDVQTLNDGTLSYKGRRVIVYIRDQVSYGFKKNDLPRFHISDCSTIQDMKTNNKWQRYVMSSRLDGWFEIAFQNRHYKQELKKLDVCKNCLDKIKFNGYSSSFLNKKEIFANFTIADYFEQYPVDLFSEEPDFDSLTAPKNLYAKNHGQIAFELKERKGWRCDECNIYLGKGVDRRYLEMHHINSCKYDNNSKNLKVLCVKCHSQEFQHQHLKRRQVNKDFDELLSLRGL